MRSQLDAESRRADRYVDLQLEIVRYKSGTPVARFGGRWDRLRKDYVGDAERSRVIEVHAAQIDAVEAFDRWLVDHLQGGATELDDRVRELVEGDIELDAELGAMIGLREIALTGGRRSGKTVVMELILNAYLITVSRSTAWTVVPSEAFRSEPKQVIEELLPSPWFSWHGDPHFRFDLVNGSTHALLSGVKPTGLKKGKANLVGVNEAQQVSLASYNTARGAVIDAGAPILFAANPPVLGDIGTWVLDAVTQIEKGTRHGAQHYFFDPLENPHVDRVALLALRSSMSEHDFQTQIRGRMLQLPDAVLYTWSSANERRAPDFGRITHEFLVGHEGDRADWDKLVVVDVQSFPFVAVGIFDAYRDPRKSGDPKGGLLWMVDEIAIAQGDEVDVCEELKRRGYKGDRTLVVMDASGKWQQATRDPLRQRPNYVGKGSMDMFRANGFPHVVPPDRAMKRNPDVMERVRATVAAVRAADGISSLYVDPKCVNAIESARAWRMHKGKPSRSEKAAHFGDVIGYAVWRFAIAPRRLLASTASEGLKRERPTRGGMENV